MFRYKNKQRQINKLDTNVHDLKIKLEGGIFSNGLEHDVKQLTTWLAKLQKEVDYLNDVIKESGIVEDVDVSDIKFKETEHSSIVFGPYKTRSAYQINKVKVK